MRILAALAASASLLAPVVAAADPAPDVSKMASDDCDRARKAGKTCVLDMKGEDIDGGVPGSTGLSTTVINLPLYTSLIHIRHDFIPEILKTAEDL